MANDHDTDEQYYRSQYVHAIEVRCTGEEYLRVAKAAEKANRTPGGYLLDLFHQVEATLTADG